jgi:monoamine oxidase
MGPRAALTRAAAMPPTLTRRQCLGAAALGLAGCGARDADAVPAPPAAWVGASHGRGHRLRGSDPLPAAAVQRRAGALVVGAGIAGLAAARALAQIGIDDVQVLELEDSAGGNSRGHAMAGLACPLGAHYLPLPVPESHEVAAWLHEIGLLSTRSGRTVADERHLCHSPQERLFIDGAWVEGLLPPAEPGSATALQYRRFAHAVAAVQQRPGGGRAFALPAHRAPWTPAQAALDAITFERWLDAQGLDDERLRWYLDYCCRDDYGAGADTVSAWAGLHYFASRHGFSAPGDEESERDAVFTWPEGNAWLVQKLAGPLAGRLHTGRTVLRVSEGRHGVQALAWDEAASHLEAWTAPLVVLALPLFVAARVLESPPQALREAAALLHCAPWLVANLHLAEPLLDRIGAPPSWDNVVYGGRGLGYVDAMHQSLRPHAGPTVLTAYHALPDRERAALLADDAASWGERVLRDLQAAHPDLRRRVRRVDLMRWGHAMAIPRPGVQRHPALLALRRQRGRVRFAHGDLAGCSLFEEAFTAGCEVASPPRPAA